MDIINSFCNKFNINPATLSGAIDVVVMEQPDGTFTCSPFHVRFGKIGVLRSREKVVDIEINGNPVDIYMKLGESGEAFFVEEVPPGELSSKSTASKESLNLVPNGDSFQELSTPEVSPSVNNEIRTMFSCEDLGKENEMSKREADSEDDDGNCNLEVVLGGHSVVQTSETVTAELEPETNNKINTLKVESNPTMKGGVINSSESLNRLNSKRNLGLIESSTDEDSSLSDKTPSSFPRNKRIRKKRSLGKRNSKTDISRKTCSDEDTEENEQEDYASGIENNSGEQVLTNDTFKVADIHFFSDSEVMSSGSSHNSRLLTQVKSDSEYETERYMSKVGNGEDGELNHLQSWLWGELPTSTGNENKEKLPQSWLHRCFWFMKKSHTHQPQEDFQSDIDVDKVEPEMAKECSPTNCSFAQDPQKSNNMNIEYFCCGNHSNIHSETQMHIVGCNTDSDYEEPKKLFSEISMSLCGGLTTDTSPTERAFHHHVVDYDRFIANPTLVNDPNLVIRIDGKMYNWQVAGPLILSLVAFQNPLPQVVISKLCADLTPRGVSELRRSRRSYSWFHWGSRTPKQPTPTDPTTVETGKVKEEGEVIKTVHEEVKSELGSCRTSKSFLEGNVKTSKSQQPKNSSSNICLIPDRYRKTLRLTSEQISNLNLRDGINEIAFSVTTAYQGTARCKCFLFKWKYNDKIVVSDIDGTITKSDIFGHIMYIVGKDWYQKGVVKLFSKIKDNGYKLLYLSSRAIGQCEQTRGQLKSIKQEDLTLPEGPVLLNPTSLIRVVQTELFDKNPEKFKISCLKDIQALFPPDSRPFYAGYGNKIHDARAYRAVGIPIVKIFTINSRGEIRNDLSQTFQSSFSNMTQIVNQMFPVMLEGDNLVQDFSNFSFWRDPIPEVDLSSM